MTLLQMTSVEMVWLANALCGSAAQVWPLSKRWPHIVLSVAMKLSPSAGAGRAA